MNLQSTSPNLSQTWISSAAVEYQRTHVKQEIRGRIEAILQLAKDLPADVCQNTIRHGLTAIKQYCRMAEKTFIVVEQQITCDNYALGGNQNDTAVLFRGPNEDASVAICVTAKGSLLHRNGTPWKIYTDAGDIDPVV